MLEREETIVPFRGRHPYKWCEAFSNHTPIDIVGRIREEFARFPRMAMFTAAYDDYLEQIERTIDLTLQADSKSKNVKPLTISSYMKILKRLRTIRNSSEDVSDDD